jgi:carbamoyltransferase
MGDHFQLAGIDPERLIGFADFLRTSGYSEGGIAARLGIGDLSRVSLDMYPVYVRYRNLREGTRLDRLIALFLLQGALSLEVAEKALGAERLRFLEETGLLRSDEAGQSVAAPVSIYPCSGLFLVTDHRFRHLERLRAGAAPDPVMYIGADSYYLSRVLTRRPFDMALDLGTGSGIHALLLARQGKKVVGVDSNPRAVNFARFNALLNGIENVEFLEGDIYGPVGGERFEVIVSNPPFVPSPVKKLSFRDGGTLGDEVLSRIIAGLPAHLAEGGICQIVTHLVEQKAIPYKEKLYGWLGDRNYNVLIMRFGGMNPQEYAVSQVKKTFGESYDRYETELRRWIDSYEENGIARISGGVFNIESNRTDSPAWYREEDTFPPTRAVGDRIDDRFHLMERLAGIRGFADLEGEIPEISPDALMVQYFRCMKGRFEPFEARFAFQNPVFAPEFSVMPHVLQLLEYCDGRDEVWAIAHQYAEGKGEKLEAMEDFFLKTFQTMLEKGMIRLKDRTTPEDHGGAS